MPKKGNLARSLLNSILNLKRLSETKLQLTWITAKEAQPADLVRDILSINVSLLGYLDNSTTPRYAAVIENFLFIIKVK